VLDAALGAVVWGSVVDRAGARRLRNKLYAMALLCLAALAVLAPTFAATQSGALSNGAQFGLVMLGAFLMTCTVGPVVAIVIDVVHPGVRATGCSVLALFQNLFGLAVGPLVVGALSDVFGLHVALSAMPLFGALAAGFFVLVARSYEAELHRVESIHVDADDGAMPAVAAT
jgi:MFS family permease